MTITELAKLAGVTHSTVSYVLNDRWREKRISPKMAELIIRLARQHHYRPSRVAHSLQTGRTQTLAAVFMSMKGDYFPRIASGIEDEAKRAGYHLLVSQVVRASEEPGEIDMLLEHCVDGLIVTPRAFPENIATYKRLIDGGVPLVFVETYIPGVPCPAVVGADEEGMRIATHHLIAQGYKRIAYVGADFPQAHMEDRLRGFRKAMEDHGLTVPKDYLVSSEAESVADLLRGSKRPRALLASNDYVALKAMRAIEFMGLRIPEDIALVGFSDCLENVEFYRVPLTSVRMDLEGMGQLAVQRFIQEREHLSRRQDVTRVAASLVVRASCGAGKAI